MGAGHRRLQVVTTNEKPAAARRVTIGHPLLAAGLLFAGAVLLAGCGKPTNMAGNPLPPNAASHARDFTSVKYFDEAPFQQQMKSRLSGADAQPLPGGLLVIKQPKLETFNTDGSRQAIAEVPECVYNITNGVANSAGHLRLQSGDGKIRTEGDGFLWRQDDSFLRISNHVHTVIETGTETKALL
jgi:hypothetical protein